MIACIVAIVLSISTMLVQGSHAVQVAVAPVEVDGDMATRIVSLPPGSEMVHVAGTEGLYTWDDPAWTRVAATPPPGDVVGNGAGLFLAGDHEPCMRGGSALDLQRSEDGGQTWLPVEGATGFRPLAIWTDPSLALASSCQGLHLSRDGGLTWAPVDGIEPGWEVTAFAPVPQEDGSGPVVLVGLTGEGGTSYLRSIDLSDPATPVVSPDLRTYFAIGGLAGAGDTYVLAAMDGVWISEDAGATWERSAEGLEDIVLEQDPAVVGFPADIDPTAFGLNAVAILPGERFGLVIGAVDGLYMRYDHEPAWARLEGTQSPVTGLVVNSSGMRVLYATDAGVFDVDLYTSA